MTVQEPSARRPTLEDVAARAGVSRALVSIVMRDVPGASADTRKRVMEVADEMGYRPDARARLLAATRSAPLLGVVFSTMGTFHLELLDNLYAAAEHAGSPLILSALTANRDERRAVETLLDFRCDAVILLGPEGSSSVLAGRLPVVVVGWHVAEPSVDVIRTSDSMGARQAIEYLVELGHRSIAYIDGGRRPVSLTRRRGYRAAMRRHGLAANIQELPGGWNQEDGVAAASAPESQASLATAVLAYNDDVAAGALKTFESAGISVRATSPSSDGMTATWPAYQTSTSPA